MQIKKRKREVALVTKSVESYLATKRAKRKSANPLDSTYNCIEEISGEYSHLLILWSQPMTAAQKNFLIWQMKDMMKLKSAVELLQPYTCQDMPAYLKMIKKPLDLSTMSKLLENDGYSSVTNFCTDFKIMITNVHIVNGANHKSSSTARKLLASFALRIERCPTGVLGTNATPANTFCRQTMKAMESLITDVTTSITKPSSKRVEVINIDCDEVEPVASRYPHNPSLSSSVSNTTARPLQTKQVLRPDDLDGQRRQLEEEIEERQQMLANLEKQKLFVEIKALDTERTELDTKIPEKEKQYALLKSNLDLGQQKIDTLKVESQSIDQARRLHVEESARLQQEFERIREERLRLYQEYESVRQKIERRRPEEVRLVARFHHFRRDIQTRTEAQNELEKESQRVFENGNQLKKRRDEIKNEQAIANKKLSELNNDNI
ncbi:hypothetical protein KCU65_g1988, partial [Aureobasidium melanogenum]